MYYGQFWLIFPSFSDQIGKYITTKKKHLQNKTNSFYSIPPPTHTHTHPPTLTPKGDPPNQ